MSSHSPDPSDLSFDGPFDDPFDDASSEDPFGVGALRAKLALRAEIDLLVAQRPELTLRLNRAERALGRADRALGRLDAEIESKQQQLKDLEGPPTYPVGEDGEPKPSSLELMAQVSEDSRFIKEQRREDQRRQRRFKSERSIAEAKRILLEELAVASLDESALRKPPRGRPTPKRQEHREKLGEVFLRCVEAGVRVTQLAEISQWSKAAVSVLVGEARTKSE